MRPSELWDGAPGYIIRDRDRIYGDIVICLCKGDFRIQIAAHACMPVPAVPYVQISRRRSSPALARDWAEGEGEMNLTRAAGRLRRHVGV
jgi:hypothetical protein